MTQSISEQQSFDRLFPRLDESAESYLLNGSAINSLFDILFRHRFDRDDLSASWVNDMTVECIRFAKARGFVALFKLIAVTFVLLGNILVPTNSYGQSSDKPDTTSNLSLPIPVVHNLDAQRRLGEELITGSEVGRNPIEGRKILEAAVAAGDVRAMAILGKIYVEGYYLPRDTKKGIMLLNRAAEAQNGDALATLGLTYLWGNGDISVNPTKALDNLQRGVKAGSIEARRTLGEQLITGWVLAKDAVVGLKILDATIASGDVRSKVILGKFYIEGYYLPRNTKKGISLLENAAAAENGDALATLGLMYLSGNSDISADPAKALDNLQRGATAGSKVARRRLGEALITGTGVAKKPTVGIKLLEEAGKNGDPKSEIILGRLLMEGRSLKADLPRAKSLFEQAAGLGDFEGIEQLGLKLMWNSRSKVDSKLAEKYLTRAGKAGRGSAWTTLAQGAVYGKLATSSLVKYQGFVQNARSMGETAIEIVEADRHMWGLLGTKASASKAISILEIAAANRNQDAIKYLIGLLRDGNGWNIKKSTKKAQAYFDKYGSKLSQENKNRQVILLRAAKTNSVGAFNRLAQEINAQPDFSSIEFQKQLFRTNRNFSIYLVQVKLKKGKIYNGPPNGLATTRTLSSMHRACNILQNGKKCDGKMLSEGVAALIILN